MPLHGWWCLREKWANFCTWFIMSRRPCIAPGMASGNSWSLGVFSEANRVAILAEELVQKCTLPLDWLGISLTCPEGTPHNLEPTSPIPKNTHRGIRFSEHLSLYQGLISQSVQAKEFYSGCNKKDVRFLASPAGVSKRKKTHTLLVIAFTILQ